MINITLNTRPSLYKVLNEQQKFLFGKAGYTSEINNRTIYGSTRIIYFSNVVIRQASFIFFVPNENPVIEEGKKKIKRDKN